MIEVGETGKPNGLFWVLMIFLIAGLECSHASYSRSMSINVRRPAPRLGRKTTKRIIAGTIAISLTSATLILLKYSAPMFLGVDRVTFWTQIIPSPLSVFASVISQSFFFCAYLYFNQKHEKKNTAIPIILIFVYIFFSIILLGEKFSVYIIYLTMWLFVSVGFGAAPKINIKFFILGFLMLLAVISLVIFSYVKEGKDEIFILSRIALQAQLMWSVMNEGSSILLSGANWQCFFGCGTFLSGEDYISLRYLPTHLFHAYKESGAGLTGFMPALPVLLWGLPAALLIHSLFSYFFGTIQAKIVKYIKMQNFIFALLLWKFYLAGTILWFAAKLIVIPGLVVVSILLILYKFIGRGLFTQSSSQDETDQFVFTHQVK
ncbi:hypothetical protein [Polaromonas sp.]|uniref:hypothetical protein n=1 Tax=Polaromonas sp. TaxID=1869339 RepID=UPI0017C9136B|nr:hypothetical protein [Polaromonas sp.]NMM05997.1 hypothetical protein [Polaromonas sp.]